MRCAGQSHRNRTVRRQHRNRRTSCRLQCRNQSRAGYRRTGRSSRSHHAVRCGASKAGRNWISQHGVIRYQTVIRHIFETLHARGARNLVLDLRRNGGGSEGNENYLFSYLVRDPLRKYASVQARGAALSVADPHGHLYSVEVFDEQELATQERLPDGRLSRRNEPPEGLMSHWQRRSLVFNGRLVVLAGGETFSGAAELSSMLYHVRRGLFVGEEVAGAHAGNTSGYTWEVRLPNSGMRLHVPLLQFRFAWDELPLGRGVPPHCSVPPDLPGAPQNTALAVAYSLASAPWTIENSPRCPSFEINDR